MNDDVSGEEVEQQQAQPQPQPEEDESSSSNNNNNNAGNNNALQLPPEVGAAAALAVALVVAPPLPIEGNNGPEGMQLLPEELARAREIQSAVAKDVRIDDSKLMDYDYVQWALTTVGFSLEVICEKVYLMQCFRQEYALEDTSTECASLIIQFTLALLPEYLLSFEYVTTDQNYACIVDLSKFSPQMITSREDFRTFLGFLFHLWNAASCDFISIRNGLTVIAECTEVGFTVADAMGNPRFFERYMYEFFNNFPKNDRQYYLLNSSSAINVFYGIIKHMIWPPERRNAFHLGTKLPGLEGLTLNSIYNTPSPGYNAGRVMRDIFIASDQRYKNRSQFSFENCQVIRPQN